MHSKKTIIIVEDEDSILLALQRILELTGEYEAIIAQDGEKALDILQTTVPDLIISDISMPNMNGIEFCKRVRENPVTKSVPFIFLTAKREKMIEGLSVGGDDFLMKPFNVEEVLAKIETLFRRINQSREQANQQKGRIEDMSVETILEQSLREKINGELILQHDGDVGTVKLENGDIKAVNYQNLSDDAALDALRGWTKGTFVIRPLPIKFKVDVHKKMGEMDLSKAHQIKENIWWVGHVNEDGEFVQNSYIRVYEQNEKKINALFEPGSPLYFHEISTKIAEVLGDFAKINIYIPMDSGLDSCGNILFFRKANARAVCMTSYKNWELLRHYEINPRSVKKIDPEENPVVKLASGHQLRFISVPYCTSPGSFMTYDVDKRVLFSGSLFCSFVGKTDQKNDNLFASESDWEFMRRFHREMIPAQSALIKAINKVKALTPKPDLIAPRYGKIISGDLLNFFMDRLMQLPVGADRPVQNIKSRENKLYIEAMNTLLGRIQGLIPLDKSLEKVNEDVRLSVACAYEKGLLYELSGNAEEIYVLFVNNLMKDEDEKTASQIKTAAFKIAYSLGINLPEF